MVCISAQPTAARDASVGGTRVLLVEQSAVDNASKGARLELFLNAAHMDSIKLGDEKIVTVK